MKRLIAAVLLLGALACTNPMAVDHTTSPGGHTTSPGGHTTSPGG